MSDLLRAGAGWMRQLELLGYSERRGRIQAEMTGADVGPSFASVLSVCLHTSTVNGMRSVKS